MTCMTSHSMQWASVYPLLLEALMNPCTCRADETSSLPG
jgi:hypothetical protein